MSTARKPKKAKKAKVRKTPIYRTECQVYDLLAQRYKAPEYALFRHVRDAAGFDGRRTIDAMCMGLWQSRGRSLHGFEIKVSRSDWLRELKQPEKQESIVAYMDYFWLVVGDPDIVKEGELPERWGLLAPRGKKLVCVTQAPKLSPRPMTRTFLASILRRAQKDAGVDALESRLRREITEQVEARYATQMEAIVEERERRKERVSEQRLREMESALKIVRHFQDHGIWLHPNDEAVATYRLAQRLKWQHNGLDNQAKALEDVAKQVRILHQQFEELAKNDRESENAENEA